MPQCKDQTPPNPRSTESCPCCTPRWAPRSETPEATPGDLRPHTACVLIHVNVSADTTFNFVQAQRDAKRSGTNLTPNNRLH